LEIIDGLILKKLEKRKVVKETREQTTTHIAHFKSLEATIRIEREEIAFEGLVVGQEYSIEINSFQTTLDENRDEGD